MTLSKDNPSNLPLNFRLQHRLRVRWAEVDMQKVVFNPHYLTYFDIAIAQYWRELALPYELTLKSLEGDLFVKKATLEYNGSAYFDETLTICLRCARIGNSSMQFIGSILRDDQELISGEIVYVFADPVKKISKPIPPEFKSIISRYEEGADVTYLKTGQWHELRADALKLRQEVFVDEQGVPLELEEDELDASSVHAVLYNALKLPIATARLIMPSLDKSKSETLSVSETLGVGKIGRMAVSRELRGTHWGSRVLLALEELARTQNIKSISLHAQCQAKGFYAKHLYLPIGETFEEAGILHIEMNKQL